MGPFGNLLLGRGMGPSPAFAGECAGGREAQMRPELARLSGPQLAGFRDLNAVSVEWVLADSSFTQVADVRKLVFAKSEYASKLVTVPASSSYHACITASYALRNVNSGRVYN